MTEGKRKGFYALLSDVYAFYKTDCSSFALGVWWEAMRPFDFEAVSRAISAHSVSPDSGQFLPKPADIVRVLQGGTQDQAMRAWSKVDAAVRSVGTYRDVVFDDPLIHACLRDMGGWMMLGEKSEDGWPFLRNEFVTRYRGFTMRQERPEYPPVMIGIAGTYNRKEGVPADSPVMLGDATKARAIMQCGIERPRLTVTQIAEVIAIEEGRHAP